MITSWIQYDKELPYIEDRNPWEVPVCYLRKTGINEFDIIDGRRPSKMLLVNNLRKEIDKWRSADYPGLTETSYQLLLHWFENSHQPVFDNNRLIIISASVKLLKQSFIFLR
jgi:type III restriction enzyme